MQLKLQITPIDGEPYQVETNLFTVVAWERKYKRKASDMANGVGIEDLAFLAHESCKQHNIVVPLMLDDFIKQLRTIDVVGQEDTNPTQTELGEKA